MVGVKQLHIGTRSLVSEKDREIISFARPASSVSELVAVLLKDNGYQIDTDIATNIVMGIEEGSNGFTSQGTTVDTFEVFAQMLRAGGQRRPKGTPQQQPMEQEGQGEPPKDWTGPKIYKGTTVS